METNPSFFDTVHQKAAAFVDHARLFGIAMVGFLLISSMFRFLFGKRNQLGKAFCSAMELLCLYVLYIVLCRFGISHKFFPTALPFLSVLEGNLQLFPILKSSFSANATQFLPLLMIAFLINLINTVIPEGKRPLVWLLLRATTIVLSIGINYVLAVALPLWLPQGLQDNASLILLGILMLLIGLGSLKLVVGAGLFVANPLIGALYTFFFSNLIGRALARALLSAGLIAALICLMPMLGFRSVNLTQINFLLLLPATAALVLLWYGADRIL